MVQYKAARNKTAAMRVHVYTRVFYYVSKKLTSFLSLVLGHCNKYACKFVMEHAPSVHGEKPQGGTILTGLPWTCQLSFPEEPNLSILRPLHEMPTCDSSEDDVSWSHTGKINRTYRNTSHVYCTIYHMTLLRGRLESLTRDYTSEKKRTFVNLFSPTHYPALQTNSRKALNALAYCFCGKVKMYLYSLNYIQ
jgi:hypothetical protein